MKQSHPGEGYIEDDRDKGPDATQRPVIPWRVNICFQEEGGHRVESVL